MEFAWVCLVGGIVCVMGVWVACLRAEVRRLRAREVSHWRTLVELRRRQGNESDRWTKRGT